MVSIGSIIAWAKKGAIIWGAGFMNNNEIFNGGKLIAVRGKLTDEKLKKDGFSGCNVYGDPALLLPLWINPETEKKYKLGIIPHWTETSFFQARYANKYKIIDLRTTDINKVLEEITSCEYILSTSLHGIIVPHAYHIPALWIKKGYIHTDGFKFHDYFSSVNIPFYDGFENIEKILESDDNWMDLFQKHADKALANISIVDIQKRLLRVAPFKIKKKYLDLIG